MTLYTGLSRPDHSFLVSIRGDVVNQSPVVIIGDAAPAYGLVHALIARKLLFKIAR